MHECEHHDDTTGNASGRHKYWQLMYDMLIREPLAPMPIDWLLLFNVPEHHVNKLKELCKHRIIRQVTGGLFETLSLLSIENTLN